MRPRWIWLVAIALYAAFAAWYDAWRGPLDAAEIDMYLARMAESEVARDDPARLDTLRAFLEADDGGEFFMVNLIRLEPKPVKVPGSDERMPAAETLERYTRPFLGGVLRRAGHPAFFAPAAGGYLEHWDVDPDPGWTWAGVIRYRSRRDLMELVTDPGFDPLHQFKYAAIQSTFAFPAAPGIVVFGPRVGVALALALVAALAHLALAPRWER